MSDSLDMPAPAAPFDNLRPTRAEVDLGALRGNARFFLQWLGTDNLIAVVKANAYGHGLVEASRAFVDAGVASLAVATVSEGVALRAAGIGTSILLIGPVMPAEAHECVRFDLTPTVGDAQSLTALEIACAAGHRSGQFPVEVEIDIGMRRHGVTPAHTPGLLEVITASKRLTLAGVYAHFSSADDEDEATTLEQITLFESTLERIRATGHNPGRVHLANSPAALRGLGTANAGVRLGLALYGQQPGAFAPLPSALRPAMTILSKIARIVDLDPGDAVSYGMNYVATERERVALIPIGYADGYPRALSSRGWMQVGDGRAPVRGRVCMDQTVVGLRADSSARVGDSVLVMGGAGPDAPTFDAMAVLAGTINYELLARISPRIPRDYIGGQ